MEQTEELQVLESIRREMEQLPGHLGFYYKNLITGQTYSVQAEEAYSAASVIKLPLFLHVLTLEAEGKLNRNDKLLITQEDKVPICGALTLFSGSVEVDINTLCCLMISLSDNTATNRLIRLCTIEGAQAGFRAMGLEQTVLRRLLFDTEASAVGIQNTISPAEMGMLLEKLFRSELVSPDLCRDALSVLMLQQVDHKLNGKLAGKVDIAHKTGEDSDLSNDVGIVYAPQPFVICFVGHDTDVYRWEDLMRRGTYDLVRAQDGLTCADLDDLVQPREELA